MDVNLIHNLFFIIQFKLLYNIKASVSLYFIFYTVSSFSYKYL
uniref:Uncharacterized protein n=1 Tax=Heterorhabditis bacteriophora TaxID=37862 RepID=A0A1I7WCL9_HETBA